MSNSSRRQHGAAATAIVVVVLLIVVLAGLGWMLKDGEEQAEGSRTPDIFRVERSTFDITIPASGELAAMRQLEIASQLDGRAVITEIVEEGQLVKKGDLLIQLDDENLRDSIKDAEVAVKNAETAWETSRADLQIKLDANASELSLADVDIRLAELAIKAWEEGDDVSTRRQLALEVETTKKDYDRLVARHKASLELLEQEFISQDEFDRDEIEMIRASSRYEQAKLAQQVYEDYQREQESERLRADLKKARDKRIETEQRNANEIASLRTNVENRLVALNRERERLAKAREQQAKCRIIAPQDGLVVYASSLSSGRWGRRGDDDPPQVGTELARNRTVMVLPDTSQMVAEVKVNEALSGRIEAGQNAVVYSDAVSDTPLTGTVIGVGVLAESGGWRDPNRRDYTVRIALEDTEGLGLKPSMRCKANIYVGRVDDALAIPVQAVFRKGRFAYVYVPDGGGFAERAVELGRSSELMIAIEDGLAEGDRVLLRKPAPQMISSTIEVEETASEAWMSGGSRPGDADEAEGTRSGRPSSSKRGDAERSAGGKRGSRERASTG